MQQVLWEVDAMYGIVVEPADRFEQTQETLRILRSAATWGEIRSAQLAPWARDLVDSRDEDWESPDDEAAWDYTAISESVTEAVPLPHDVRDTQAWLGRDLLKAHADISGASPGGHGDSYRIRNLDEFLAALERAGYEPVHRPGFYSELLDSA